MKEKFFTILNVIIFTVLLLFGQSFGEYSSWTNKSWDWIKNLNLSSYYNNMSLNLNHINSFSNIATYQVYQTNALNINTTYTKYNNKLHNNYNIFYSNYPQQSFSRTSYWNNSYQKYFLNWNYNNLWNYNYSSSLWNYPNYSAKKSTSPSIKKGAFLDGGIEGLKYISGRQSGLTDIEGIFKYEEGKSIEFSIGNIVIGDCMAKPLISPIDLVYGAIDASDQQVINIARFLQTLDDDGYPSNGIYISQNLREVAKYIFIPIDFSANKELFENEVQALVNYLTSFTTAGTRDLISEESAFNHLNQTLLAYNLIEFDSLEFESLGVTFPNSEDDNNPLLERASTCYGCHSPESDYEAPIAIIDAQNNFHHPMGEYASKGNSPRALGMNIIIGPNGGWDKNNQLNCLSCHDYHQSDYTNKEDNNNYLRWDFKDDSAEFCIQCHNDKSGEGLGLIGEKHHQTMTTSPLNRKVWKTINGNIQKVEVKCANCMFCHYIHDGLQDRPELFVTYTEIIIIPPELEALMRVPAKVLPAVWADEGSWLEIIEEPRSNEPVRYEDMCYGCHGRENIVNGDGSDGSLLRPDIHFSHRYAVEPNPNKNPAGNMGVVEDGIITFPVSDGPDVTSHIVNDYGVKEGYMYCGSCHNAHDTSIKPYLNGNPEKHDPYKAYLNEADGFCQGCHQGDYPVEEDWINHNHPVSKGPSSPSTTDAFYKDPNYRNGGSGNKGAIFDPQDGTGTGKTLCLSCHNAHAAMTNYDGSKAKKFDNPSSTEEQWDHGKLLVIDNNQNNNAQKSDLCIQCHPM